MGYTKIQSNETQNLRRMKEIKLYMLIQNYINQHHKLLHCYHHCFTIVIVSILRYLISIIIIVIINIIKKKMILVIVHRMYQ